MYLHSRTLRPRPRTRDESRRKRERERERRKRVTQNRERYRKNATRCFRRPRAIVFERKMFEPDVQIYVPLFPSFLLLFLRACDHKHFEPHRVRVDKATRSEEHFSLFASRRLAAGRPVYGLGESWFKVSRGGASCSSPTRSRAPPSPHHFSVATHAWSHRFGGIHARKIVEAM